MLEQIRATLLEEYSVSQWVLLFFLYSFCGWCWEVFLYLVKERRFVNRGFLFGPILPIYGFGAVGILLTCVPVEGNMALVALVGTIAASLLEYVTGFLMETIFHVRYWDYSERPLNLNGYICALSAATWAVFSVFIVSVVNPFVKTYIYMIPLRMADAAAAIFTGFAVVDTGFAVRRALDLRALLESMERYARELQALHGGLDSINERVNGMIRDFAAHVDSRQEELAASAKRVTAARDRVREMMDQKRLSLEDGAKERFANLERVLNEAASYLPDVSALRAEVEAARAKYDRQSEIYTLSLHDALPICRLSSSSGFSSATKKRKRHNQAHAFPMGIMWNREEFPPRDWPRRRVFYVFLFLQK